MKRTILSAATLVTSLGVFSSPATADERARAQWAIDVVPLVGVEPKHDDLGGGTLLLYGADLRLRLSIVSLGFRWERTNASVGFGEPVGFTRALPILGFNFGLGERTEISPYLGLGWANPSGFLAQHTMFNAKFGIDLDYFLARFLSIGGGLAMDLWGHGGDGIAVSRAMSATVRLGFHLPFG